jgi:hypothetical protein
VEPPNSSNPPYKRQRRTYNPSIPFPVTSKEARDNKLQYYFNGLDFNGWLGQFRACDHFRIAVTSQDYIPEAPYKKLSNNGDGTSTDKKLPPRGNPPDKNLTRANPNSDPDDSDSDTDSESQSDTPPPKKRKKRQKKPEKSSSTKKTLKSHKIAKIYQKTIKKLRKREMSTHADFQYKSFLPETKTPHRNM